MSKKACYECGLGVSRDTIGINKKLLGSKTRKILCLTCLATFLDCTEEDLRELIEDLKERGCTSFI